MGISRDKAHKRRLTGGRQNPIRSKRKFELGRQPANTRLGENKVNRVRVRGGNYKFRALRLDQGNFTWPGESVARKTRILKVVYNATSNELVRTNTLVKGAIVQVDSTPFRQWYQRYYGVGLGKNKDEEEGAKKKESEKAKEGEQKEGEQKEGEQKHDEKSRNQLKREKKARKERKAAVSAALAAGKPVPAAPKTKETPKAVTAPTSHKSKAVLAKHASRLSGKTLEAALQNQFKTGPLLARLTSRPGQCGRADGVILEGDELAFYIKKMGAKKKK